MFAVLAEPALIVWMSGLSFPTIEKERFGRSSRGRTWTSDFRSMARGPSVHSQVHEPAGEEACDVRHSDGRMVGCADHVAGRADRVAGGGSERRFTRSASRG